MIHQELGEIKRLIRTSMAKLTKTEAELANFFINNSEIIDFSSKCMSRLLYVSEATLSRFAQKCGFKGYREFIYCYEKELETEATKKKNEFPKEGYSNIVHGRWMDTIKKNQDRIDESVARKVAELLNHSKRILICGTGNATIVSEEIYNRLLELKMDVTLFTDTQFKRYSHIIREDTSVIVIVVGEKNQQLCKDLITVHEHCGRIILLTTSDWKECAKICDYTIQVSNPVSSGMDIWINPQLSLFVTFDVLYAYLVRGNE